MSRIVYQKLNLMIDGAMKGDGTVLYSYNEQGEFLRVTANLILWANVKDSTLRFFSSDKWQEQLELTSPPERTTDMIETLLYTMIVKESAYAHKIEFEVRRTAWEFSVERAGKSVGFWLIDEQAPYMDDPAFTALKRVQAKNDWEVHTFSPDGTNDFIISQVALYNI